MKTKPGKMNERRPRVITLLRIERRPPAIFRAILLMAAISVIDEVACGLLFQQHAALYF
jgi:hypothetical protein